MSNIPEKNTWDVIWLSSKVILAGILSIISIISVAGSSTFLLGLAYMTLDSRLIAVAVGISSFISGMAGVDWLRARLVLLFFSSDEVKYLSDVNSGEK